MRTHLGKSLARLGRPTAAVGIVALLWALVVAPAPEAWSSPSVARASDGGAGPLTAPQLAADLNAAAFISQAPTNLTPSLSDYAAWETLILRNGCQLSPIDLVKSKPCVYGDTAARTSAVLFGDSHAGVWFPAVEQISRQRHWRLLIFTKAGCAPPEVMLYPQCETWRRNAEAQIAAIHPAIVFVSWARWLEPKATAEAGVPTGYGGPWQNGVAAIFRFLGESARRVVFISDVPTLKFGAARCISSHLTDVTPCNHTSRPMAIVLPKIRAEEFQLAQRMGVASIDPIPWFCTHTACPVLVRNFLVYYDSSHMTPAWSAFIAPVLAASVRSILGTDG